MFRLAEDRGVINRYGFNSHGLSQVKKRLEVWWHWMPPLCVYVCHMLTQSIIHWLTQEFWNIRKDPNIEKKGMAKGFVGVNLGKNKLTEKAEEDYIKGKFEVYQASMKGYGLAFQGGKDAASDGV